MYYVVLISSNGTNNTNDFNVFNTSIDLLQYYGRIYHRIFNSVSELTEYVWNYHHDNLLYVFITASDAMRFLKYKSWKHTDIELTHAVRDMLSTYSKEVN